MYSILYPPPFETFLSPLLMREDFYIYLGRTMNMALRDDDYPPLPLTGRMDCSWQTSDDGATPQISFPDFEKELIGDNALVWGSCEIGMIPHGKIPARILLYRCHLVDGEPEYQMAYEDAREEEKIPAGFFLLGNLEVIELHRDKQVYEWECVHITTNFGGRLV